MKSLPMVLLLLVALPASAEFEVVEETETMTVYREGDHVIVLLDTKRQLRDLNRLAKSRSGDFPSLNYIKDEVSRRAGTNFYLARVRLLDGELVCEKIASRPAPEIRAHVLAQVASRPCQTGVL